MKKLIKKNEFYVLIVMLALGLLIQWRSGEFFTVANFADIIRGSLTPGLIALAFLMVLISGGLDLSFPAIAALAAYIPLSYCINNQYQGSVIWPILIAMGLGAIMGIPNAYMIGKWRLPPLIVTLGTCQVYRGILMGGFNAITLTKFPQKFVKIAKASILTVPNPSTGGTTTVTPLVFVLLAAAILVYFILKYTRLGRSIYAIGGSTVAAERVGFSVIKTSMFLYCFSGAMAALAAMLRYTMLQTVQPSGFDTMDMTILSMVVIGGGSLSGGKGTVTGTLLGVFLITIINNSLILMGIDTYWQQFMLGLIIVIGAVMTGLQSLRQTKMSDDVFSRYEATLNG